MAIRTNSFRPLSATSFYSHANLVRYCTMDDLTEKNGNNLTNSGCTATTGKFSGAYSSGSSNSANRMYNSTNLGINGGACTITAWIKLNSSHTVSDHPLAVSEYSSSAGILNGIGFNQGNTAVQFSRLREAIAWNDASYSYSPGTSDWHFYAYTYDGSTVKGYVDGVLVASASASGSGSNTGRTTGMSILANDRWGIDNPCSAQVDDCAFFNAALSASDILALYAEYAYSLSLGQYVGAWASLTVANVQMDGSAIDCSGNVLDGTPTNASFVWGKNGSGSASFNGSSSIITLPFAPVANGSGSHTWGAWIKPSSLPSSWGSMFAILRGHLSTDWGYLLRIENTAWVSKYKASVVISPTMYTAEWTVAVTWEWARVIGVFDTSTVKIYVNGSLIATTATWSALRTSSALWIQIGNASPNYWPLDGLIDEVFVDKFAWTASEAGKDYAHSLGRYANL